MVELYRRNSNFGELMVWEHRTGSPRYYLNDFLVQNIYDPRTKTGLAQFTYMLHGLARAYTPEIRDVLCIGLGVGLVPAQFAAEGARVEVFEINPDVAEVAREYFDCPLETFQLRVGDGRQLLNQTTNRYDSVILDAFLGDSSPGHLMSVEAFESIRGVLRPEGSLVINCFAEFGAGKDFYGASLDKTLRAVFPFVKIHATGAGNVYFVASMKAGAEVLRQPDYAAMNSVVVGRIRQEFMATLRANPDSGIVLTDDYNPVEVFDAPQREETRKRLARTMQSL
jgi:spermidine synthase